MTGATGNIYCGLHEFTEMSFVIHLLQSGDVFLDVGANVGSYTILASKVCGAKTVSFEPDPTTAAALRRNIALNEVGRSVEVKEVALGNYNGEISFTYGRDTTNRVASSDDKNTWSCPVRRLDDIAEATEPTLIKLDVEGFEEQVIAGAAKILASHSLLAILTEFENSEVRSYLASLGFEAVFYDPFSRRIGSSSPGYRVSNTLFVRRLDEVTRRLNSAPTRSINGVHV